MSLAAWSFASDAQPYAALSQVQPELGAASVMVTEGSIEGLTAHHGFSLVAR